MLNQYKNTFIHRCIKINTKKAITIAVQLIVLVVCTVQIKFKSTRKPWKQ